MERAYEIHWNSDYRGTSNITLYEYRETPKYDEDGEMIGYDFSYVYDKPHNLSIECGYITIPPVSDILDTEIKSRVFLYSNEKLSLLTEFDDKEDAHLYCLEVHSELNGCSPFDVTGFTSSYKETGHYGLPTSVNADIRADLSAFDIKASKLPVISLLQANKEIWLSPKLPVFCLIVQNNGAILDILSIRPFS